MIGRRGQVAITEPRPASCRAGRGPVSSFGISGTNAHDSEAAPAVEPVGAAHGNDPVAVPGAVGEVGASVDHQARRLLACVGADENVRPLGWGWPLVNTRSLLDHRAVVGRRPHSADGSGPTGLASAPGADGGPRPTVGKTASVFPGQQWPHGSPVMLPALVPAEHIHRCERALREHVERSLLDVLRAPGARGWIAGCGAAGAVASRLPNCGGQAWFPTRSLSGIRREIAAAYVAGALLFGTRRHRAAGCCVMAWSLACGQPQAEKLASQWGDRLEYRCSQWCPVGRAGRRDGCDGADAAM